MTIAKEPTHVDIANQISQELKSDAPLIAESLFKGQTMYGSHEVGKPDFLKYWRRAWTVGVQDETGARVAPDQWRMQALERWGADRFMKISAEAFGLPSPSTATGPRMTIHDELQTRVQQRLEQWGVQPLDAANLAGTGTDGMDAGAQDTSGLEVGNAGSE